MTNLRGEFVLTSNSPITYADLKVEGNGVAPRIVAGRKPEANPHTIKMTAGVTLTGRLVRDGKPVVWCRRRSGARRTEARRRILGDSSIGTDEHGGFTFLERRTPTKTISFTA